MERSTWIHCCVRLVACAAGAPLAAQAPTPVADSMTAWALARHARAQKDTAARRELVDAVLAGGVALPSLTYYSDLRLWHRQDSTDAARRKDTLAVKRLTRELDFILDKFNASALSAGYTKELAAKRAAGDTATGVLEAKIYQAHVTLWQALLPQAAADADTIPRRARGALARRGAAKARSMEALSRIAAAESRTGLGASTYAGERVGARPEGRGVQIYGNGDRYEGQFHLGRRHGRGVMEFANGIRYDGQFVDGQMNGKAIIDLPSGARYVGAIVEGRRTGEGVLELGTGEQYTGWFKDDRFSGHGLLEYVDGGWYDGAWKDGKRDGQGTERFANDRILKGLFENDRFVKP